jgi:hypothetical protein
VVDKVLAVERVGIRRFRALDCPGSYQVFEFERGDFVGGGGKYIPNEWGERAISFWEKDLMSLKGSWPVEWEANMPVLRIVTKLEDI